jgi:RNA polymerase sigma factor (sigma-70 family)
MERDFDIRNIISTENLESVEGVETRLDLQKAIDNLPLREKQIVYLFACGHTQGEIAEMVGCCQQRISQILANISKRFEQWH